MVLQDHNRFEKYKSGVSQFDNKISRSQAQFLKINHKYLVLYNLSFKSEESTASRIDNLIRDGKGIEGYSGEMTKGSVKRLREACELMIAITDLKAFKNPTTGKRVKYRIGLLTLTLSSTQDGVTDRQIKKDLLEPMLRTLRGKGLKNYVWKAEKQKNGNIHFHIFVDCFLDMHEVREIWNKLQGKHHFIRNFTLKHGHSNPNSTDIKAVSSENGLVQYMLKYMLKPVDKAKQLEIKDKQDLQDLGKTWDCSKALKTPNLTADFATSKEIDQLLELLKTGDLRLIEKDYCKIFYYENESTFNLLPETLRQRYEAFLNSAIEDEKTGVSRSHG